MKRILTAKIQKLNPTLPEETKAISKSIIIEPETRKVSLQKGKIYATYDIAGENNLDIGLISKVVHDILHDTYYESETISPTQTLEKSIVEIRNNVTNLSNTEIKEFNLVAGVLWGNVLYTVQYGTGKSYLVREGEIREINTLSEGNFSAASGVVNDNDVVIMSTQPFDTEFPPSKLMSSAIPEKNLGARQSSIIMKFVIDTEFSENEIVDFGLDEKKKPGKIREIIKNLQDKAKRRKALGNLEPYFNKKIVLPIFAVLLLVGAINRIAKNISNKQREPEEQQEQLLGANTDNEAYISAWNKEKETDTENKVIRIDPEAFYDMKITKDNPKPTELLLIEGGLVVVEKETGELYTTDMDTPNFTLASTQFPGIQSLNNAEGILSFSDEEGYKYLDLGDLEIVESYEKEGLDITATYLDFIYSIDKTAGEILKHTKNGNVLNTSTWGESESFKSATSMTITYSIYITTSEGEIEKYTQGEKEVFEISNVPGGLSDDISMVTYQTFDNIYIADKGNKRIVIVDQDGEFVKQYKTNEESSWDNIIDLTVSEDEKYMYILNGSKIFVVGLDVEPETSSE